MKANQAHLNLLTCSPYDLNQRFAVFPRAIDLASL